MGVFSITLIPSDTHRDIYQKICRSYIYIYKEALKEFLLGDIHRQHPQGHSMGLRL